MSSLLTERLTWDQAKVIVSEAEDTDIRGNNVKSLYMKGIFIEGDLRNQNQRVYPVREIGNAVNRIKECIDRGETIWGEADHPEELNINLDRVSHMVTDMWLDGSKGIGKLKIVPTPMGNIVRTLIECGGKLGVSSRGSGEVDGNGNVSNFVMETVDIVARPSAPNAYPRAVYETLMNMNGGMRAHGLAAANIHDPKAQKYLREEVLKFINELNKK